MTRSKRTQAKRRDKEKDSQAALKQAALQNLELIRDLPGMDMSLNSELDGKILASAAFNCE